jgi:hypothetical protein
MNNDLNYNYSELLMTLTPPLIEEPTYSLSERFHPECHLSSSVKMRESAGFAPRLESGL